MKKRKLIGLICTLMLTLSINELSVKADSNIVEVTTGDELKTCLRTDGNVCTLMNDIDATGLLAVGPNSTVGLDLNGNTLNAEKFQIYMGIMNIVGKGTINANAGGSQIVFNIFGSTTDDDSKTELNVGKDVSIVVDNDNSGILYAIGMTAPNYKYGIKVNYEGKLKVIGDDAAAVTVHGYFTDVFDGAPTITFTKDSEITGNYGLYGAGYAIWNLSGKIVTDKTPMEIRAGKLNITDGEYVSNATGVNITANGSGSTVASAAIAVAQHTTKLPIDVRISGGKFVGPTSFIETNPQNNPQEAIDTVKISITGGNFVATNNQNQVVYSADFKDFVSGGTFNQKVDEKYIAKDYTEYLDDNNHIVLGKGTFNISSTSELKLEKGKATQIVLENSIYNKFLTYTISDNDVISLTDNTIKALKPGKSTITVKLVDELNKVNIEKKINVSVYEIKEVESEGNDKANETAYQETVEIIDKIMNNEDVSNVEEIVVEKIKEAVENGQVITTELVIEKLDETKVDDEVKEKMAEEAKKIDENAVVLKYIDVSVIIKADNSKIGNITNLSKPIKIAIDVPKELQEVASDVVRTYFVVRIHDGKSTLLETKYENGKLVFETDSFSDYAYGYVDTKKIKEDVEKNDSSKEETTKVQNPKTGDSVLEILLLLVISTIGIGYFFNYKKIKFAKVKK